MLREMGIRLWLPEDEPVAATSVVVATAAGATIAEDEKPVARSSSPSSSASAVAASRAAAVRAEEPQRLPGLAPADWLVVGDALDPADPQQQQLLENMLRAIGVGLVAPTRERRAVYVAVDATPIATAIAAVAPRCVLALGKAAAAALLGADAPLGGLRGRVHAHAGVAVVVTFAPAFLLRHPAEKAKAWADLCLAVGALSA